MRYLLLLFTLGLAMASCKKECMQSSSTIDTVLINDTENVIKEYFPLTVGSYWIYEGFINDSVYVAGDTIIHNDTFAIVRQTFYGFGIPSGFLRDSGDYIINEKGIIYFSAHDFTDTLNSGIIAPETYAAYKMADQDSLIHLSIGSFQTLNYKAYLHNSNCPDSLRYLYSFYARNIGLVKSSLFYASSFCLAEQTWSEQNLIRFHIAE